ncbi:ankyrin repeat-containing domain protein [Mycena metata]|uniref:Ankyrin repeat-containing domain protein n=1 Tax=Mycena metata TaxID=1033252 RepID=A0AAD7GXD1_9AGAR|nr:ankyrin repeat-containing domain protein [Mycena metata]
MATNCTIPSNPDVSGVGVRAAIYAQNLICFLPVIIYLWDRNISRDELKGIKDQSIGMLAVAFAILLTTIILAKDAGGDQQITSYHAAVVLDLSWMNNTSTWIWFILYVHHRSTHNDQPTGANWSEWHHALLEPLREFLGRTKRAGTSTPETSIVKRIWHIAQHIWHFISEQPVLTLGSIHLSLMAAVGIWLWSDPSKFGLSLNSCDPTLTVVGLPARFSSKPLRIVSLTMYSIVLIPGLNLIPPFTFFLHLHILYNWSRKSLPLPDAERSGRSQHSAVSSNVAQPETSDSSPNTTLPIIKPAVSGAVAQPGTPRTAFLIVGLVFLVTINIIFIADIEVTLRRNKGNQNGDDQWGFGQVLALLLLIIPLRDAWGALSEIGEKLKNVQKQFEELLLRECQATPVADELGHLIKEGAKDQSWTTNTRSNTRFSNALQLVAFYGKKELVQFLLKEGFNDKPGGHFHTSLQAAAAGGHVPMVEFLLKEGFDDKPGGHFHTALQAAAAVGHVPMTQFLLGIDTAESRLSNTLQLVAFYGKIELVQFLQKERIQDTPGGHFHTALQAAAAGGHVPVVQFLLKEGFDDKPGGHFHTSLQAAAAGGHVPMVEFLLKEGFKDTPGGHFHTGLHAAAAGGHVPMVQFLLKEGFDDKPVLQGGHFHTALQAAAAGGHIPMTKFLLGIDTAESRFSNTLQLVAFYGKIELVQFLQKERIQDTPGGHFHTALQAAAAGGHVPVVQFLLKEGFDDKPVLQAAAAGGHVPVVQFLLKEGFNDKPGGHFHTSLQAAAAGGHVPMVEFLLKEGFDDKPGGHFHTALQAAAAGGHVPVVQFLLKEGFDDKPGGHFHTALQAAAAGGHVPVVQFLLKEGFNDKPALQAAAAGGHVPVVQFLLKEGFDDKPGGHFHTALQAAAAGGHVPMVEFLLKEGFEDKPGGHFHTALQAAAAGGHVPVVKFLLKIDTYVVDVNKVGGDYGTALCAACVCGKIEVVKALLGAGARRDLVGEQMGTQESTDGKQRGGRASNWQ